MRKLENANFIITADLDQRKKLSMLGYEEISSNGKLFLFINNPLLTFDNKIDMCKVGFTNKLFFT